MSDPDIETEITLGVLNAVEENSRLTQRSVAKDLGIALGLTNTYLKKCIKKGLIKVIQAPANRYIYYLTPHGFAEKSRLTSEYLSISFNFFREARTQIGEVFEVCESLGWRRVVLCGSGDLAEIAALCSARHSIEILGIVGAGIGNTEYADLKIFANLDKAGNFDAAVIVEMLTAQETFDEVIRTVAAQRVLAPRFLNISRSQPKLME